MTIFRALKYAEFTRAHLLATNAAASVLAAAFFDSASISASLAVTESLDVAVFTAAQKISLALAATERRDTAAFGVGQKLAAVLAATEVHDAAAFSLSQKLSAAMAATGSHDTAALSAALGLAASLSASGRYDAADLALEQTVNLLAALAATESRDVPACALSQRLIGTLVATERRDAAAFGAVLSLSVTLDARAAGGLAAFSVSVSTASTDVWALQMWNVQASVMPDEDFRGGPLEFFAADGVTPLDLSGITFTARIGAATLTSAAGQIVVSGNALNFVVPAGSVNWRNGRFRFSLMAQDGVHTHDIFANSTMTVGLPLSFSATPFGSRARSINLVNTPNGWGKAA